MIHTNWTQLAVKSKYVPLGDITKLASRMERMLNAIKQGRRNSNQLMEVKTGMQVIIRALLSLIHTGEIIKRNADMVIFARLQENFGRAWNILEESEKKISSHMDKVDYRIMLNEDTLSYIAEMESILYGDIYFAIKRTLERNPQNEKEFMYYLYEILSIHIGVFGSEGRARGKTSTTSKEPTFTAKDMLSDDGQKKLDNEWKQQFKGFEGLKIGESVF